MLLVDMVRILLLLGIVVFSKKEAASVHYFNIFKVVGDFFVAENR